MAKAAPSKKTAKTAKAAAAAGGEGGKKKARKSTRVESYNTYIYKVLKQVHPGECSGAQGYLRRRSTFRPPTATNAAINLGDPSLCSDLSLQRWASPRRACPS